MIVIMVSFFSCSSEKKLTFLYDMETDAFLPGVPEPPATYLIKPNDNLYINVSTINPNPEVSAIFNPANPSDRESRAFESISGQYINGYIVDESGFVELPIIGKVKVSGLSMEEATDKIKVAADEYLKGATVQVKYLSFKVTVMGEVNRPGVYYNYSSKLTIFEAISMAAGITDYASLDKTTVVREYEGGTKPFKVDLTSKKILDTEVFYLQPNDVIYIQPQKLKNTRQNTGMFTLFLSTISTALVIFKFFDTSN